MLQNEEKHILLAIIREPDGSRSVARVAYGSYDEMLVMWKLADDRRRAGRDSYHDTQPYGVRRLDYLAVRAVSDKTLWDRYPHSTLGRFSALLTRPGVRASVRIYGNSYGGTVVSTNRLTAIVRFTSAHEVRERSFPIMPPSRFDRGVHGTTIQIMSNVLVGL